MDILNFISWVRGGRKFTNVDPNTTLLPVGVRDNRRDDKYLTGGISVTDFGNALGAGIEIPKLIVRANGEEVLFSLDFYKSDTWKTLNPRIFLYRMSRHKRVGPSGAKVRKPKGFVHPTNTAGTQPGGRWWTGEQTSPQLLNPLIRHTEFPLTETLPYKSFMLPYLNRYEWLKYKDTNTGDIRQTTESDFPIPKTAVGEDTAGNGFYISFFNSGVGTVKLFDITDPRSRGSARLKLKFKFAIVIDNPNPTPDRPFLIGPMSESVVLRFAFSTNGQYPGVPTDYVIPIFTPDHITSIPSTIP